MIFSWERHVVSATHCDTVVSDVLKTYDVHLLHTAVTIWQADLTFYSTFLISTVRIVDIRNVE